MSKSRSRGCPPGRAQRFQFLACGASCFCAGQALRLALGGFLFQVEPEFLSEFGFPIRTPQEPTQFSKNEVIVPPDRRGSRSIPWRGWSPAIWIARGQVACAPEPSADNTWHAYLCRIDLRRPRSSPSPPTCGGPGRENRSRRGADLPKSAECVWRSRDRNWVLAAGCGGSAGRACPAEALHGRVRCRSLCRDSTLFLCRGSTFDLPD
jgi:hypothetical protein